MSNEVSAETIKGYGGRRHVKKRGDGGENVEHTFGCSCLGRKRYSVA
jgi:hypothetical protein